MVHTFMKNQINGCSLQQTANHGVFTITINRQRFVLNDVIYKQWNQFFRKMKRSVVIEQLVKHKANHRFHHKREQNDLLALVADGN
jgi:hypothetical protein